MKKYLLLLMSLFFLIGCSSKNPELNTVQKIDINKYLGTWYEIARYEHSFEKDCKNVSANYSLKKDNEIKVINQCTNMKTNKTKKAIGSAYSIDETNSKLKVSFFWPFYGDYWILDIDENYTYALIGEPSRKYFWILSREKQLDKNLKKEILNKLPNYGYDEKSLIWTIQE
ncbi:MAG: hypothetical protein C0625_00330 [Arcobacter sp.]|nr:MAG: hypothetical protein C0625_00330 [Arcobacter sp.]